MALLHYSDKMKFKKLNRFFIRSNCNRLILFLTQVLLYIIETIRTNCQIYIKQKDKRNVRSNRHKMTTIRKKSRLQENGNIMVQKHKCQIKYMYNKH